MIDQMHDTAIREGLAKLTVNLDDLASDLSKIGTLNATEIRNAMKMACEALHESAKIVRDHAEGDFKVSDATLSIAARAITAAQEVLDEIIFSEARRNLGTVDRA